MNRICFSPALLKVLCILYAAKQCCRQVTFFSDDARTVPNRKLSVPEVYGPALSRDHVVFGAARNTAVDHQR